MAVKVFVVIVIIQLCWTMAQSDTQPRDVTHHNDSTPHFQICRLDESEYFHSEFEVTLYRQLSGSASVAEGKPMTDLWTSNCELMVTHSTNESASGNPLEYHRNTIKSVDISNSNITSFPSKWFCYFSDLKSLLLSNNRLGDITKLGLGLNYNCSRNNCGRRLDELDISGNPLKVIKNNSFCHLRRLTELYLDDCELAFIESGAFLPLKNLIVLNLSGNRLKRLHTGLFQRNLRLLVLIIQNNQLDCINVVLSMTDITILNLSHNAITSVRKDYFIDCTRLSMVNMSHNAISSIEEGAFDWVNGLSELDLSNNQLQSLNDTFLNVTIKQLFLNNNQLTYLALDNLPRNVDELYLRGNLISRLTCKSYGSLYSPVPGLRLIDLSNNRLNGQYVLPFPKSVSTIILNDNKIDHVSFTYVYTLNIKEGKTSLQEVDLRNNSFSVVPVLPHRYDNYDKITPIYNFNGNPLLCTCENAWFIKSSRTQEITNRPPCIPLNKVKASHLFPHDNILNKN